MTEEEDKKTQTFISITNSSPQEAKAYLESSNWNIEVSNHQLNLKNIRFFCIACLRSYFSFLIYFIFIYFFFICLIVSKYFNCILKSSGNLFIN